MRRWYGGVLVHVVCGLWATAVLAAQPTDAYIAGYVAAIVERDFQVPQASVTVQDGVVRLHGVGISQSVVGCSSTIGDSVSAASRC